MTYIKGQDRGQITFLPDCIEDLIRQDSPVRVIDAFVDSLDMEEAGFQKSVLCWTGRPPYDPRDLLNSTYTVTSTRYAPAGNSWQSAEGILNCFFF
jgi:transposase